MVSFAEAKDNWVSYGQELKQQRDDAVAALTDAQAKAQEAADALAQFQADDSATDAQQLADQAAAFAQELQDALDALSPRRCPIPAIPARPPRARSHRSIRCDGVDKVGR